MNKTQRKHPACKQCLDLIQTLTSEIKQLQSRQQCLKKLNNTLIQNLIDPTANNQYSNDWKIKYQRQVQRSCRLQRQLMEIQIQSEIQRKTMDKKKDNMRKLNDLIMSTKLQGVQNYANQEFYTATTARKMSMSMSGQGNRNGNRGQKELIVKIVR